MRVRVLLLAASAALALAAAAPTAASANVLLVCQTNCPAGGSYYSTIQAAVDAASAGDWVLVWPGDYKEQPAQIPGSRDSAGVGITKADIHLRGMDRASTIVDGTKPGTPACSSKAADQNEAVGSNGVEVYKASGSYIENLTVCNYLDGNGGGGNEIWWNGGDGSGQVFTGDYWGNYISGTSTYYDPNDSHQGAYGIFVSNMGDLGYPSSINYSYASNMNDSSFYVGACGQQCNMTLDHVKAENSAIGFSGTNAGGRLVIQNSEWDNNRSGIVPNTLNNDDGPPPQDGACPGTTDVPCMTIQNNDVHDNNNANAPGSGIADAVPVGTGIELAATTFIKVLGNTVHGNKGWGIVAHDYPDTEQPPSVSSCQGGYPPNQSQPFCFFPALGNQILNNTLYDNGGYGNPSNGDLANESAVSNPRNCFYGNTDPKGPLTSDPAAIETVDGLPCNQPGVGDSGVLAAELVCASGLFGQCPDSSSVPGAPPVDNYPQPTSPDLAPFSNAESQPAMPNPCTGVPDNAWCSGGNPTVAIP